MMPLDYPYPREDEQGIDFHYKPFRLLRLTSSLAIQSLVRAIIIYLASNPRSGVSREEPSAAEPQPNKQESFHHEGHEVRSLRERGHSCPRILAG
jgi:hypothetical protein